MEPAVEDLLVFGYACKLFRDDARAIEQDEGHHLIPWMGDPKLTIDRYDARGALYKLSDVEAPHPNSAPSPDLSPEERAEEALADEERWRSLHKDETEDVLYKEEEAKRSEPYAQVAYQYDESNATKDANTAEGSDEEEDDEPFVVPPGLVLPPNLTHPPTKKVYAIIERTATFIASQGPQMEIVIKMRQSNNPRMKFLDYHDTLNPFYRHLLAVIKAGEYRPQPKVEHVEEEEDTDDDGYLHPSLLSGSRPDPAPITLSLPFRPSANCAYTQLVTRIRDQQRRAGSPSLTAATPSPEQQLIIDKMASYAAKNGQDFEAMVASAADSRFDFLQTNHPFHTVYRNRLAYYVQQLPVEPEPQPPGEESEESKSAENVDDEQRRSGPVSFHIRTKEPETSLECRSALLQGESSGEEGEKTEDVANGSVTEPPVVVEVSDEVPNEQQLQQERKRRAALFLQRLQNSNATVPVFASSNGTVDDVPVSPPCSVPSEAESDDAGDVVLVEEVKAPRIEEQKSVSASKTRPSKRRRRSRSSSRERWRRSRKHKRSSSRSLSPSYRRSYRSKTKHRKRSRSRSRHHHSKGRSRTSRRHRGSPSSPTVSSHSSESS